jgi:hypothetical protein
MECVDDCVDADVVSESDDHSWGLVGDIGRWIKKTETQPRWEVFNPRSPVGRIVSSKLDDRVEMLQASD